MPATVPGWRRSPRRRRAAAVGQPSVLRLPEASPRSTWSRIDAARGSITEPTMAWPNPAKLTRSAPPIAAASLPAGGGGLQGWAADDNPEYGHALANSLATHSRDPTQANR